ncbi:hypothetical protein NL676_035635 [Syzygium grande]|nr:hypothetical protein NL676_035635 [Syzygium grande]
MQRIFRHLISPTKSNAKPLPLSFSILRGTRSSRAALSSPSFTCTFLFVLNPATPSFSPWLSNLFASSAPSSYLTPPPCSLAFAIIGWVSI